MVVSSVHIVSDFAAGPQMVETFQTNLETLGAKKSGNFLIECDTYYSNAAIFPTQKLLNLLQSSEYPASAFSLIENGPTIVADSSFEQIITNLSNFYSPKKLARVEVRGQKWTLGDFIVKLGSCTMGANFKAVIAEIEYGPCSVPSACWDLIKELGRSFVGPSISKPHQHLLARMNELYGPVDTIHQYNDIFNQIKKQTPQGNTM
ncbi:mediator complex subunit 20 [Dermatophagoides farinae]|uniref:Mediator of RNA polymerase II transcription subunit 20 n=1 Tax=Dermatophagoides farinae TaxID=6954 RepID=A0A922I8E4_DERFA|nr:mediator of RNA polymerase II transcription subunit 20-like [Dermatophagoides farinae]KAH7641142.1 mediator of rna polymerase ii transcription subunit 20-like protein [Dermatophagoides farinae]KAH9526861.1 mediator complex subunit Med20 [Dermatophagoides farinae]